MPGPPLLTAVFNVTQGFSGITGLYADGTNAQNNSTNLNKMIANLLDTNGATLGRGGVLEFPSSASPAGANGLYAFSGTITISTDTHGNLQPASIVLRGTGQGNDSVPLLQQQDLTHDFFLVAKNTGTDNQDIGGVVFQDLMLSYAPNASGNIAAVHVGPNLALQPPKQGQGSSCVRLYRVTLLECPIGYWLEDSLSCSMIDCQVLNTNTIGTPVMLGSTNSTDYSAIETYIAGCKFLGFQLGKASKAVQIYGCEHLRMSNVRIEGWGQGIVITPTSATSSVQKVYFGNVSCFPYQQVANMNGAAVYITVSGGNSVSEVWFAECEFATTSTFPVYNGPGVILDPGTDSRNVLDQIRFISCSSCRWLGPGMDMIGGTNIEVLGGYYSCNGQVGGPGTGYQSAGIQIGAANGVRINGAACNNSLFTYNHHQAQTQQYGIYVGSGAKSVRINGCDLTANLTNSLVVDASQVGPSNIFMAHSDCTGVTNAVNVINPSNVVTLEIFDCAGYNDQRPQLNGGQAPALNTPLSASNCSTPYFGPSVVTFSNPQSLLVRVTGTIFTMSFGDLYLSRPTDPVGFGGQPSVFGWVGK